MYIGHSRGPRTDPCVTPYFTGQVLGVMHYKSNVITVVYYFLL